MAPDQIILASCRQQALFLSAQLLLHPGQSAVVEEPCDLLIESILREAGAVLTCVPVDAFGLRTDLLPSDGTAAVVHVTPEHQRPLGTVMSLERRQALLAWAIQYDAVIVEEASDAELRFDHVAAPPLMSLDRNERVIHTGCFAAALGPGITLGYLVVPPRLAGAALAARRLIGGGTGWLEEAALAEFFDSGAYALHLHRLRKVYLARRDILTGAIRLHFGDSTKLTGAETGLDFAWTLPGHLGCSATVADIARRCGLDAAAVAWSTANPGPPTVLLGFGTPSDRKIAAAVGRMAATLAGHSVDAALSAD